MAEKIQTETVIIPHKSGPYEIKMPQNASLDDKLDALKSAQEFVKKREANKKK